MVGVMVAVVVVAVVWFFMGVGFAFDVCKSDIDSDTERIVLLTAWPLLFALALVFVCWSGVRVCGRAVVEALESRGP